MIVLLLFELRDQLVQVIGSVWEELVKSVFLRCGSWLRINRIASPKPGAMAIRLVLRPWSVIVRVSVPETGRPLPPFTPGLQAAAPLLLRDSGAADRLEVTDFTQTLIQPVIDAAIASSQGPDVP